ncbi:4'-phosphopantetheinyl transferase family protein [Celerinatantimonas yamalensis]|uniref:Enterobactin synthase component D n=1 Tax=Celerinatantimonas yamalensis TaxID=559956 RepID=A0ABW9G7V0_9GAMM
MLIELPVPTFAFPSPPHFRVTNRVVEPGLTLSVGVAKHDSDLFFSQVDWQAEFFQDSWFGRYAIACPSELQHALSKRRAEFFAGRLAALNALTLAGSLELHVPRGVFREPLFPEGFIGSISHSGQTACSIVSAKHPQRRLGLDLEFIKPQFILNLVDEIVTPDEKRVLQCYFADVELATYLAFSTKESLFKALFGEIQQFIGFQCVSLDKIDIQQRTFSLRLNKTLTTQHRQGDTYHGVFELSPRHVFTLCSAVSSECDKQLATTLLYPNIK